MVMAIELRPDAMEPVEVSIDAFEDIPNGLYVSRETGSIVLLGLSDLAVKQLALALLDHAAKHGYWEAEIICGALNQAKVPGLPTLGVRKRGASKQRREV